MPMTTATMHTVVAAGQVVMLAAERHCGEDSREKYSQGCGVSSDGSEEPRCGVAKRSEVSIRGPITPRRRDIILKYTLHRFIESRYCVHGVLVSCVNGFSSLLNVGCSFSFARVDHAACRLVKSIRRFFPNVRMSKIPCFSLSTVVIRGTEPL